MSQASPKHTAALLADSKNRYLQIDRQHTQFALDLVSNSPQERDAKQQLQESGLMPGFSFEAMGVMSDAKREYAQLLMPRIMTNIFNTPEVSGLIKILDPNAMNTKQPIEGYMNTVFEIDNPLRSGQIKKYGALVKLYKGMWHEFNKNSDTSDLAGDSQDNIRQAVCPAIHAINSVLRSYIKEI